jgi:hypothetical protein
LAFGEGVLKLEGVGDPGDDGGVETEEQASEGSGEGALDEEKDGSTFGVYAAPRFAVAGALREY